VSVSGDSSDGDSALGHRPLEDPELDALESQISKWLDAARHDLPAIEAVDRGEPGERRWYVRLAGEQKDHITIWFSLRQRSLAFEIQVIPAPEENHAEFYEMFLRRNDRLGGMAFAIGDEDAMYLVGRLPNEWIDEAALDRVIGSAWAYVEQAFRPALRVGFASRLSGRS
jgi:hypothetical protein